MQSPLSSLLEALLNILVGAAVSLLAQLLIFPQYGLHPSFSSNLWITFWFTLVSLLRSYFLRRWFNRRIIRAGNRGVRSAVRSN